MDTFSIFILAILALGSFLKFQSWLYPGLIHAIIWLIVVVCAKLTASQNGELSELTYGIITSGALAFSLASLLMNVRTQRRQPASIIPIHKIPNRRLVIALVAISVGLLPFFIQRTMAMASQAAVYGVFFRDLRAALSSDILVRDQFGILAYAVTLSFVAAGVAVVRAISSIANRHDRIIAWISVIVGLTYAVLTTGRTFLVLFFLSSLGCLISFGRIKLSQIFLYGGIPFFGVFGLYAFFLGKGVSDASSVLSGIQQTFDAVSQYFMGGVFAFNQILGDAGKSSEFGARTLRFLYAILQSFGLNVRVEPLMQEFVETPIPTNVYTVFQWYYLDFGTGGAVLAQAFFGAIHGYLYRQITRVNVSTFSGYLYGLSLYPLMFQFFQDQYMSIFSLWAQYVALGWVGFSWKPDLQTTTDEESEILPQGGFHRYCSRKSYW